MKGMEGLGQRRELTSAGGQDLNWEVIAQGTLACVSEAVVIADRAGVIRLCNIATEQLFGYEPGELVGKKINVLMPAYEAAHHDEYMHRYLEKRESDFVGRGPREVVAQGKDGTAIVINIALQLLETGGEPMFVAAMAVRHEELRGEELGFVAEHDSLTGLYNYHYFQEELERVIGRVERGQERTCALLFLDLDGFKRINDSYGHEEGDRVLMEFAKAVVRRSRKSDLAARLYADKFAVLLYGISDEHLSNVAESFRGLAGNLSAGEEKGGLSTSAVILPLRKEGAPLKEALRVIEQACRAAKGRKDNRAIVLPPTSAAHNP